MIRETHVRFGATSAFVRPSSLTAVTTSLANDMDQPPVMRSVRCRETDRNYLPKPDTPPPTTDGPTD
jgi:hypothetical protein